jgi:hypothetical protein
VTSWTFLAALSWMMGAKIGFAVAAISLLTLVMVQFAALVALTAVTIPVFFARAILTGSATAGAFAALYAAGIAVYSAAELGPTKSLLLLGWLALASAMAARETMIAPFS